MRHDLQVWFADYVNKVVIHIGGVCAQCTVDK